MSREATDWAWSLELKASQKLLILSLADRADEYHCCYPSIQRLVKDTGMDKKTIAKWINQMIDDGLIIDTGEKKGRTKQVRVLRLNLDFKHTQKRETPKNGNVPNFGSETYPILDFKRTQKRVTESVIEPNIEPKRSSSENSDESSDKRLEDFLSAHPEAAIYTPSGAKWGTADDLRCAEWIFDRVKTLNPAARTPNWKSWANTIRLMRQLDGRTHREIAELFDRANRDSFWCKNILSPEKLRAKWDELTIKLGGQQHANNSGASSAVQQIRAARQRWERERACGTPGMGTLGTDGPDLREPLDAEEWQSSYPALDNSGWEYDTDPDHERL